MDPFGPEEEEDNSWRVRDRLPARWMRLDFTSRDLDFLKILLEQKFLSGDQIRKYFFQGTKRYGLVRVWKMRRFKFVKRILGFHPQGLFLPTERCYEYFKTRFVEVPAPMAKPDPRTVFHDLAVTDIRFLFQRLGFGSSWTSERVWRMGRSIRLWAPDAVIEVGGDAFALEVERVQKETDRYEDIFRRYQQDPEIAACLYLTTASLFDLLLKQAGDYPRIYFAVLRELFEKKEKTVFRNAQGSMLEIEENLEANLQAQGQGR